MPKSQFNRRSSRTATVTSGKASVPDAPPSKREQEIHRFLRASRYKAKREQLEERFKFRPSFSDDMSTECGKDPSKDVKRIQRTIELDDADFLLMSDLTRGITMMMLCAGNQVSLEAPLDTQFLFALQRISDTYEGRVMSSDEEWRRVGAIEQAWSCVRRTLGEIEQERKAKRAA